MVLDPVSRLQMTVASGQVAASTIGHRSILIWNPDQALEELDRPSSGLGPRWGPWHQREETSFALNKLSMSLRFFIELMSLQPGTNSTGKPCLHSQHRQEGKQKQKYQSWNFEQDSTALNTRVEA